CVPGAMRRAIERRVLTLVLGAACHERSPEPPAARSASSVAPAEPEPRDLLAPPTRAHAAEPSAPRCPVTTDALPASPLLDPADPRLRAPTLVVAHKSGRRLMLFAHGQLRGCWAMGLGFAPEGHKHHEGDGRTPEGWYRTSDKPWSDFPGAIAIHYPNHEDATDAWSRGLLSSEDLGAVLGALALEQVPPQQTPMGGEVLIHGGGSREDWTLGCMALDDDDLAELRATLPPGQRTSLLVLP
ncbi:MAG: L,D-transpeptidase family protein, partial [Myxococcales bacterium]|nr:L,D-transpeptidase family protein [Myxococcales bacterium]